MNSFGFAVIFVWVSFAFAGMQPKKFEIIMEHVTKLYQSARSPCISETGINEKQVQIFEAAEPVEDKKINCYAGCIMIKMDIINGKGQLRKWQLKDVFDAIMDDELNGNAKYLLKTAVKALEQSKDVCESGKVAIKLMQTIFYQNAL